MDPQFVYGGHIILELRMHKRYTQLYTVILLLLLCNIAWYEHFVRIAAMGGPCQVPSQMFSGSRSCKS